MPPTIDVPDRVRRNLPEATRQEIQQANQRLRNAPEDLEDRLSDPVRNIEKRLSDVDQSLGQEGIETQLEQVRNEREDFDLGDARTVADRFAEDDNIFSNPEAVEPAERAIDALESVSSEIDADTVETAFENRFQTDEPVDRAQRENRAERQREQRQEQLREQFQEQTQGAEPEQGFQAPGPEVRQATRSLREQVREETGLERGEVRIQQTIGEDGTVQLEARAEDGATVTETIQNNNASPAEDTRQELREIDQFLPDQQTTTEDDRTLAEDAVAAGVEGIRFSESVGEDVAEQTDLTEGSPAGPNPLGLASRTLAAGSDLAQGEPRQAAASALPFVVSSEEAEVTETIETGVVSGPGQLASFGVGATGASVQAAANTLGEGDGPGVGESIVGGAGLIAQQARENPREFAVSEISEEIGEGVFTAGVGAAVPTVTPEITPSSVEAETPDSVQTAAAFVRGELGTRVQNQDVTTNFRLQEPAEEGGIDPEVAVSQIEAEVDDSGVRTTEVVTRDQRDRVIARGRRTETPVSRRQFLRERAGLDSVEASDVVPSFSLTGTSRGSLQLPTSSRTTDPEPEPEPEPENEPLTREQVREQASSELRNADTLQPESPLPDTFTTPTQRPTLDQVQSPIQSPVQEPFQTPFTRQRPDTTPEVREETTVTPDQRTEIVPEQEQTPFVEQIPQQETVIEQERRPEPEPEPTLTPSPDFGLGEEEDEEELFGFGQDGDEEDSEFSTSLVGEAFGVGVTDEEADADNLTGLEGRIR